MSKPSNSKRKAAHRQSGKRNIRNSSENALRTPPSPSPPVVAAQLLSGEPISFAQFLSDERCGDLCILLLGQEGTAAGKMVSEFRKALGFPAFYHGRPGKLSDSTQTKKLLKKFARRAYGGDPDRRGVHFWERVAWLLWNAYAALMALRDRAEKIRLLEIQRIARLPEKRAVRAKYMRRYRAQVASEKGKKEASYFTSEARSRWRKRRQRAVKS